jgi:hypothetical protein
VHGDSAVKRNGRTSIPLIVAHTHEHGDHTWGDKEVQALNDPALISMHGTPKRLALRDFSVWPSGPSFGSPAENEAYKKRVDQQRAQMWDHDKQ